MERRMAENLAWIRRFTLSLLKQCPDKNSVVGRLRQCGWSEEVLTQVLVCIGVLVRAALTVVRNCLRKPN
jgi:hypothetical protein